MTALNETFKTIELLPPEVRQEVLDYVEFLAQKYLGKQCPATVSTKSKILDFAGAWKDMPEDDFDSLVNDVYERRKGAFKNRRDT